MSIRARLLVLALIAVVPLMIDRARLIEANRAERIAALSEEARALTRQGIEAQQEIVVAVKSLVQVVARAHATLAGSAESCGRFLAGATTDAPWMSGLSIAGANGRVVCSTAPNGIGVDLTDRPYFQDAVRSGTFIVGAQALARARGGVGLVVAMPILNDQGRVDGVIAAGFELPWIERVAAEAARRPGAMMLVLDDAGTVLAAHPARETWLRRTFESSPLMREITAREDGIAAATGLDGVRRFFGFARLPNTNAFLAVGLDEAGMLRRVDREMRTAYLQFALIGAVVLFGIWFGGEHAIVRPLRALARMAVHIGHGNLQVRASRRRWAAEFLPLASALDAMALRLAEREEELRVANARLDRIARLDSLSGLANRRSFDLKLEEEWRASVQSGRPLALIMIDVDHFKSFNDHYGHVAGDLCLRTVADTLAASAPGVAIVARYGGEEFALLLAGCAMERALAAGEALRAAIEALNLTHLAAPSGRVTASVGVAALPASERESAQVLVEAADAALYAAKRRGRNAVAGHGAIESLAPQA